MRQAKTSTAASERRVGDFDELGERAAGRNLDFSLPATP